MKVLHAINRVTNHPLLQKGEGKREENIIMTLMNLQK